MAEGRRSARGAEEGRHGGRTGAGGGDDESSDGRAVELSLRLRTGGSSAAQEEEAAAAAARRRRSMTIFYDGRVCAVEVTELQAKAIISMANQEILTEQQRRDHDRHHHQGSSSSSNNSNSGATTQCGVGSDHQNPTAPAALLRAAHCQASPASRQGHEVAAAAPMISHAATGLSMKRSLQQFLQKRKTRAAAVASPYAGGRPAHPANETLGGA